MQTGSVYSQTILHYIILHLLCFQADGDIWIHLVSPLVHKWILNRTLRLYWERDTVLLNIQTHSDPIRSIKEQIPSIHNKLTENKSDEEERTEECTTLPWQQIQSQTSLTVFTRAQSEKHTTCAERIKPRKVSVRLISGQKTWPHPAANHDTVWVSVCWCSWAKRCLCFFLCERQFYNPS